VTLPLLCGGKCRIIDETGSDWKKDLTDELRGEMVKA